VDLRTLRSFIAVVDAGSLSKAAASRFIAQPAIAQPAQ
jgi:DNA-binding transcriptional LysR family regulator